MDDTFTVHTCSAPQTQHLAELLGQLAPPNVVIALIGDLAAGKTTFTQGLAHGLGIGPEQPVTSPTFVLIQEYLGGRLPLFHFDTYRLGDPDEFAQLGIDEYFSADGICLIEWADLVTEFLPPDRLVIQITVDGPTDRQFNITPTGPTTAVLCQQWKTAWQNSSPP